MSLRRVGQLLMLIAMVALIVTLATRDRNSTTVQATEQAATTTTPSVPSATTQAPTPLPLATEEQAVAPNPADAQREIAEAQVGEAILMASELFDHNLYLPEWSIDIGEPDPSADARADIDNKRLIINANANRSSDDYVVAVLHQLGHAVDVTYLSDAQRLEFRTSRGHDPSLTWRVRGEIEVGDARWSNSAEDFAEVFVAWVLAGDYQTASTPVAVQPSALELSAFCELIALESVPCS